MEQLSTQNMLSMLSNETLTQPKVLLVEDCKFDTVLVKKILDDYYPFTLIDHCEMRQDALNRLRSATYDVILLDLHLPDSTSLDDILEFRLLAPNTPLIIVTGQMNEEAQQVAKKHGANGIVSKANITMRPFGDTVSNAVDNIIHL